MQLQVISEIEGWCNHESISSTVLYKSNKKTRREKWKCDGILEVVKSENIEDYTTELYIHRLKLEVETCCFKISNQKVAGTTMSLYSTCGAK
jgi:hypothetical protein